MIKSRGSLIITVCCLLLQFSNIVQKRYLFTLTPYFGILSLVCLQGLLFLLYPLLGHLADVYLTRYRTLKCGVVVIIAGEVAFALSTVILVAYQAISTTEIHGLPVQVHVIILLMVAGITAVGIGLFEANAIQFGLDQLLEAHTLKLIAFIHWYYWSNVGNLFTFYVKSSGHLAAII